MGEGKRDFADCHATGFAGGENRASLASLSDLESFHLTTWKATLVSGLESEERAMSPISGAEGLEALNQIAAANREMADRVKGPGWYSWSLSLMMGGLAAVQEFPLPVIFGYEVFFFVALFFLVRAYRRTTGVWIPGYRAGRTRWVAIGGALVLAAVMMGGVYLYWEMGIHGACIAGGVILAALTRVHCYLWAKAYRRDLGVA